ncbi:MAG: hypothetical protein WD225_04105 [Ilumatobacteraceae bacterium]
MKVAVSIPDELFERAERLAAARGLSRSRLYADGLRSLLEDQQRTDDRIVAELDRVYAGIDSELDPAVAAAQTAAVRERW